MGSEVLRVLADEDADSLELGGDELARLYEALVTARGLDECSSKLHADGKIGFYVAAAGLEAVSAGVGSALEAGDWAFPSHRDVAMYLLRGGSLRSWLDQLFGNAADLTRGRQMPGHHSLPEGRFVSVSGPIGTQIVQAVGCAMAMKTKGDGGVTLAVFGAAVTGGNDFQAAINLAARLRAPVVFVCRTPVGHVDPVSGSTVSIASIAEAVGVSSLRVDGGDVLAVRMAVTMARETATHGGGPTLIEALVEPSSLAEQTPPAIDPVMRYREYLEARGLWDAAREEELRQRLKERLDEAVAAAAETPPPPIDSLLADVYSEPPWMLLEQREMLSEEGEDD